MTQKNCEQFLVSYGSTGRANRLTPPSQCQRSCDAHDRAKVARGMHRSCLFRRFGLSLVGLPGVAAGADPTSPVGLRRTLFSASRRRLVEPIGIEPTT